MPIAALRSSTLGTAVAALGVMLAGCSGSSSPQTESLEPSRPEKSADVKLEMIDQPALAKVLEGQRGKVVLVDFWATWCQPCMELFPHTVDLHKRFADRGLVVISLSLDDPDDARAAALEFLTRQGASFHNYISPYGVGPQAFEAFEIDNGALPHLKLYDRDGNLQQTFNSGEDPIDPQQIDRAIEELLGET